MKDKSTGSKVALGLVIAGAINWGLIGLFGFNLVAWLFSGFPVLEQITYIVVGVAAFFTLPLFSAHRDTHTMHERDYGTVQRV